MKYITALLILAFCSFGYAEDNVTIAVRTNLVDTPRMIQLYNDLAQHAPPRMLRDNYHGLIGKGPHILGGDWIAMTNNLGHVWMVNNFRKAELETTRYTYQYDQDGNVTNTITHGLAVNQARIDVVKQGLTSEAFKIEINQDPSAKVQEWGLFYIKDETTP